MAKQGEIDYLKNFGEAGVQHAAGKPFSDAEFSKHLIDLGLVSSLLPPAPARVLDLGCGSGWTSCFLAKRGYDVVGQDIAPDMIELARQNQWRSQVGDNLTFLVADYEDMEFADEFDAAIFFDSLHHAVDDEAALRMAYRSLRPGGVCITSEPGEGHARNPASLQATERFQVTEKDMPARRIIRAARKTGFKDFRTFPHLSAWAQLMYRPAPNTDQTLPAWKKLAIAMLTKVPGLLRSSAAWAVANRRGAGIVMMTK